MRLIFALLLALIPMFAGPAGAQALRKGVHELTAAEVMALRRGVAVMMSRNTAPRDSADFRRSWIYWANVHAHFGATCRGPVTGSGMGTIRAWDASNPTEQATWCSCVHGADAFLPWHRMVLFYFERVLQQAAGSTTLRLPYWDVGAQPSLPPIFRDRTYVNEQGQTVPNPLYVASRTSAMNAGTGTISPFGRSAANAMGATSYGLFRTRIENAPHGTVHCTISGGCPNGLMGSIPASANDPIFWAHHTNIDRLYECWLGRGSLPTTGLGASYRFIDRDGSMVTRVVRDMLTTAQLGYRYSAGSDCGAAATSAVVAEAPTGMGTTATTEGAAGATSLRSAEPQPTDGPARAGAEARTSPANAQRRPAARGERARARVPQAGQRGRRAVRIENVTFDRHPGVMFDVFLETPEGRRQIGVMSFFGDEHHAAPKTFDFDATEAIAALGLAPGEEPEIVFVPTTGVETPAPEATTLRAAPQAQAQAQAQVAPGADIRFGSVEIVTE